MAKSTTTYGIIGYPVEHSLSPLMHNAAFKALGIKATYKLFPLQEEELDQFFKDLREEGSPIFGLNVTVPYKEKVMEYLDGVSLFAKKAMSVNTIVISPERKMTGYNTDGPGFLAHLAELKFNTTQCVAIGMITSEIISNAIKHGFYLTTEPKITINLNISPDKNTIVYTIKDNGSGLESSNKKEGLGTRLIDIFARQMEAEYVVRNTNGLEYEFKIPYVTNDK